MKYVVVDTAALAAAKGDLAELSLELQAQALEIRNEAEALTPRAPQPTKPALGHIADHWGVMSDGGSGEGEGGARAAVAAVKPFGRTTVFNPDFRSVFLEQGAKGRTKPVKMLARAAQKVVG